jgi:hypothetical protein
MRRLGPSAAVALLAALDALLSSAAADCTCRAQGRDFQLGERACLTTPNGARLATCGMVLNNSSWEFSEMSCTVSAVLPPGPRLAAQISPPPPQIPPARPDSAAAVPPVPPR